jgi:hypothetical protein
MATIPDPTPSPVSTAASPASTPVRPAPARKGRADHADDAARARLPGPVLNARQMKGKNLALLAAYLFLWLTLRFLYIQLHLRLTGGFSRIDNVFLIVVPVGAFFFNWYWLREQRTDAIIRWSLGWAAGDFAVFVLATVFGAAPLHTWMSGLFTAST